MHKALIHPNQTSSRDRGFTLIELMVAVAILIIVLVAIGKIFATVSRVSSVGEANADILQEATAIERQLRTDIENLSRDGFFAIRSVAVQNNVNVSSGGPLLNPTLGPDEYVRADQLVFFRSGVQPSQQFVGSNNFEPFGVGNAQASISRVYYGHGFQLETGENYSVPVDAADAFNTSGEPLFPWSFAGGDDIDMFEYSPGGPLANAGAFGATQPPAFEWTMARQQVLLADDTGSPDSFLTNSSNVNSVNSIWADRIRNSRVDIATTQLGAIRRCVNFDNGCFSFASAPYTYTPRPWQNYGGFVPTDGFGFGRDRIAEAIRYPRAEQIAPSQLKVDQMLSAPTLSSACSSFIVEWTWEEGVGRQFNEFGEVVDPDGTPNSGDEQFGYQPNPEVGRIWMGMPDVDFDGDGIVDQNRGVATLDQLGTSADPRYAVVNTPISYNGSDIDGNGASDLNNIEGASVINQPFAPKDIYTYKAFFGYNQTEPYNAAGDPDDAAGYTPWPTALRVTMTLHDPEATLERGRVVQFVINLPQRR